jgi:aspartyl-tRNA(Asn)/glutamyl-tRNA(Gln) amidotransferase subunit A
MTENIVFKSLRKLAKLLQNKKISPMDLTEIFLKRLESLGPKYNAVVTVTRERAYKQARKAEEEISSGNYRGPLHGIPYGVKDLLATSDGIPTTWGAAPFQHQIFNYDATIIKRLDRAGAILVAKLAMIELAGCMGYRQPNASFTGPCRNPWNTKTWTGGSSSGSGAAVAAGLVPFSIGSETWGSILIPANNCGIAGLRPTYGLVSRYGAMALSWTLDKLGPMCLTADDCGLVLEAISGKDPNDHTTTDRSFKYKSNLSKKSFKIAVPKNVMTGIDEKVRKNFENVIETLKKVSNIQEIEFPDLPYEQVIRTIINAESASAFEDFTEKGLASELTAPADRFGPYARTIVLAKDYIRALRIRGIIAKTVDEALSSFDVLIAPTRPNVAPPIDKEFRKKGPGSEGDIIGAIGNIAGLPSISVPSGFTKEGLPTGVQFIGKAYEDNKILAASRCYQSLTDYHKLHPPSLL